MRLAGLITAGGRATRMGGALSVDKGQLRPWGESGPTLLERAHGELSRLASPVWVACRGGRLYEGYACVTDAVPDCGPMGGIEAGLAAAAAAGCDGLVVMACDMPFMTAAMLQRLLEARAAWTEQQETEPLMTAFSLRGSGFFQCLSAVYAVAVLPLLRESLRAGRFGLYGVTPPDRRCIVEFDEAESGFFFNINTPEDLLTAGRGRPGLPTGIDSFRPVR